MAFWSGTDNNDDGKRNRYSVVIGKLNNLIAPDIKCRLSFDKRNVDLAVEDLFVESDNYTYDLDFAEEIKKLSKPIINHVVSAGFKSNKQSNDYWHKWHDSRFSGGHKTPFSKYEVNPNEVSVNSYGVTKCTRCGKFGKIDKMFVDATDVLCSICHNATLKYDMQNSYDDDNDMYTDMYNERRYGGHYGI